MSKKMNAGVKGVLLGVGAYAVTMGAIALTSLAIILLIDPQGCNAMGQALVVLWVTIAIEFLASVAAVGLAAWKIVGGAVGCLTVGAVYGVVMLASYIVIAFGLMVAFNC